MSGWVEQGRGCGIRVLECGGVLVELSSWVELGCGAGGLLIGGLGRSRVIEGGELSCWVGGAVLLNLPVLGKSGSPAHGAHRQCPTCSMVRPPLFLPLVNETQSALGDLVQLIEVHCYCSEKVQDES